MMQRTVISIVLAVVAAVAAWQVEPGAAQAPAGPAAAVDRVFSKWTSTTPGCAVGVAQGGQPVLLKAYGMADLEHDVPNTPDTIFEAGSVAKQFTAAAVLMLVGDGKLSLDDPARKYVPELPDYGAALTIRHLLNHTSGLRDWGSLAGIAGWPRTTRVHTHAHVLDIVSRQKALNYPTGSDWSYTNTGFNLAAIIVSRVSGQSFAEFSKTRLFAPIGMTKTSWRDDHTRIVKGRAVAYADQKDGFHIEMPFENVHGNGGLLTTVGDLLKWNEHYVSPKVGARELWEEQRTVGRYNDGRPLDYGLGLYVRDYRGVKNVFHSGSTAGYRAHLNRFPESHTSVAVLCNVTSGDATRSANLVSDIYLGDRLGPAAPAAPAPPPAPAMDPPPSAAQLANLAGTYVSDEAEVTLTAAVENGALVLTRRPDDRIALTATAPDTFRGSIGTVTFRRDASGAVTAFSVTQERVWDLRFTRRR